MKENGSIFSHCFFHSPLQNLCIVINTELLTSYFVRFSSGYRYCLVLSGFGKIKLKITRNLVNEDGKSTVITGSFFECSAS